MTRFLRVGKREDLVLKRGFLNFLPEKYSKVISLAASVATNPQSGPRPNINKKMLHEVNSA